MTSGAVEELVEIARRFAKSPYGPIQPPFAAGEEPAFEAMWETWPRERQLKLRPVLSNLFDLLELMSDDRTARIMALLRGASNGTVDGVEAFRQIQAEIRAEAMQYAD